MAPAKRSKGSRKAMRRAYRRGLVFQGDIDIPVIDLRPYLESVLDMHNTRQSFVIRKRMINAKGNADNQVIWFADGPDGEWVDPTTDALDVLHDWLENIEQNAHLSVDENKPALAVDRCFDAQGLEIASGDHVWDGIIDNLPTGACSAQFPVYGTSRSVSGGPFEQSIFQCFRQTVAQSIARGEYGLWTPSATQQAALETIFPKGVCDYSLGDRGAPNANTYPSLP